MAAVPSIGRATGVARPVSAPEADATRSLYENYQRQIYNYCLHQLSSREEAEDAVQTTFMNAFRGLQRGVVPETEQAWLFKIAENVCLSRRRSSWRRGRVEAPNDFEVLQEILPSRRAGADELIGLEDALGAMPENQRRAILLREWQGLSYREIADELEISQAAVETLIFRARRTLAQGLEEPPEPKRKRALRRGGAGVNFGTLIAGLKSLLTGGAAVKAVAVAVAAGTATIAATETQKPQHRAPARPPRHAAHVVAPVATHAASAAAPAVVASAFEHPRAAVPSHRVRTAPPANARRAAAPVAVAHANTSVPAESAPAVEAPATPAAAPPAEEPKPVEPPVAPLAEPKHDDSPGTGKPSKKDDPEPSQPLPPAAAKPHGNANGNGDQGKGNANGKKKDDPAPTPAAATPPAAPAADPTHGNGNGNGNGNEKKKDDPAPAAPAPAAPTPAPVATAPASAAPVPAADANGNGNGNGAGNGKEHGKGK